MRPALTLGIEEEYLLVDPQTRDLVADPSPDFMTECKDRLGEHVTPEFLKCQVEIGTPVCADITEARRRSGGSSLRHHQHGGKTRHEADGGLNPSVRAMGPATAHIGAAI